ncbi:MAG: hypothetical protein IIC71_10205 [Acidobacteria bacterium]|nr:hypothetical protein [Acidobacteriota bacterium]
MDTTHQRKAPEMKASYDYSIPTMTNSAVWHFLRRSQRLASSSFAQAVEDYQHRVRENEPYGDSVTLDTFRERYLD